MPYRVENGYNGFLVFSKMFSELSGKSNVSVTFDFELTTWFEANYAAVFSTIIEILYKNKCEIYFQNVSEEIEIIFMKNGFYETYDLGMTTDTYNSTIPFRVFNTKDEEGFTKYLDEEVIPKINLPLNNEQIKIFKKCLQEVFENTRIHANSDLVYACGQYFYRKRKVAFTMADLGETIGENVRKKVNPELVDHSAITWSTEFGNTTKPDKDGGIGLFFLKEQMYNNGVLNIISGNGYWEQNMDSIFSKKVKYNFGGTIVNLVSDLSKEIESNEEDILF